MNTQTELFQGRQNRDAGMKRAIDHADSVHQDWKERAFRLLKWYVNSGDLNKTFLAEDVRKYTESVSLPEPPSKRSWGAVIMRAVKEGVIKHTGQYAKVKNPKANCANAAVWTKA